MPYATLGDVELAAGGAHALVQLSDLASTGAINVAAVEAAIAAADAWIDSHAQHRHRVPFDPVPQTIRDLSAAEAVYRLKTRRRNMVSDRDHAEHEERLVWLRDLAKGLVSPGTDPRPRRSTSVVPAVLERPETEDISREALKGFA